MDNELMIANAALQVQRAGDAWLELSHRIGRLVDDYEQGRDVPSASAASEENSKSREKRPDEGCTCSRAKFGRDDHLPECALSPPYPGQSVAEGVCPFCDIAFYGAKVEHFRWVGDRVMSFEPLNPVTPGHRLFVPLEHVGSAAAAPLIAARTMEAAAQYVHEHVAQANIITSVGEYATQTVRHLHVHVVPRHFGDDLKLPWSPDGPGTDAWKSMADVPHDGWKPFEQTIRDIYDTIPDRDRKNLLADLMRMARERQGGLVDSAGDDA